jgi:hypothetical protein
MEAGKKIAIISGIVGSITLLYFVLRKPKLSIININWNNKTGSYKFGNMVKKFDYDMGDLVNNAYVLKDQYNLNGGYSYKNRFLNVINTLDKKKTIFTIVDGNDNVIETLTIDWLSKLKY